MVSWWVPYLSKRCMPDFNNSPGGDLNSDPVLTPGNYLSLTRIMAPTWVTLGKDDVYICSGLIFMMDFLVVTIYCQGPHA